jgi:hypothetical protein
MRPRWLVSVALALILAAVPAGTAFGQPGSDDLADATPVTSLPFTDSVDASEATMQAGEPDFECAPVHATVWFSLTLGRSTFVTVDTAGSDYDTVLTVYQGTGFGDFEPVACNDDVADLQARVSFTAAAGRTYFVQAGAFGEEGFDPAGQLEISFARGSMRPTIFQGSFRGRQAVAEWFSEGEQSFSDTFVLATDGSSKFGPGKPIREPILEVAHFSEQFDPATETVTLTDFFGFLVLEPGQFGIDRRLRHAFVEADLTLAGSRCVFTGDPEEPIDPENGPGEECEFFTADVAVSVTWQGEGPIVRSRFLGREQGDDFHFMFRSRGAARDAVADGSITGDVDLVSGLADFAAMVNATESIMEWVRTG